MHCRSLAVALFLAACSKQQAPPAQAPSTQAPAPSVPAPSTPAPSAQVLLKEAIAAHWQGATPAPLTNVKIVGIGTFKGQTASRGTIYFQAPATWAVDGTTTDGAKLQFGMSDDLCWRRDDGVVTECTADDRPYKARFGQVLRARLLQNMANWELKDSFMVEANGRPAPAAKNGDLTFVFDPQTHLLIQVRHDGDSIQSLSDVQLVGGALLPRRRQLTIGGVDDVEDRADEFILGGADLEHLRPPLPSHVGEIVDGTNAQRELVSTDVVTLTAMTSAEITLRDYARAKAVTISSSDGIVLTALPNGRWNVALTLEPQTTLPAAAHGVRVERLPPTRAFGMFVEGTLADVLQQRPRIAALASSRAQLSDSTARWQIVLPPGYSEKTPMPVLLRMTVKPE